MPIPGAGAGARAVRDWAYDNDVPRVGNSFAFTDEIARNLADYLAGNEYVDDYE